MPSLIGEALAWNATDAPGRTALIAHWTPDL